ncbi:hypothetical protein [Helicobacter cinaedi]|nr:hypothetical protein [Helicobacter cinaedi]BBB20668.1 hypothetical protein HC081234_18450 [Helicobacter cinaedi]
MRGTGLTSSRTKLFVSGAYLSVSERTKSVESAILAVKTTL